MACHNIVFYYVNIDRGGRVWGKSGARHVYVNIPLPHGTPARLACITSGWWHTKKKKKKPTNRMVGSIIECITRGIGVKIANAHKYLDTLILIH